MTCRAAGEGKSNKENNSSVQFRSYFNPGIVLDSLIHQNNETATVASYAYPDNCECLTSCSLRSFEDTSYVDGRVYLETIETLLNEATPLEGQTASIEDQSLSQLSSSSVISALKLEGSIFISDLPHVTTGQFNSL